MHESLYERNIIFMLSYERKIFTTLYYLFEAFYVHLQRCCCYTHNVRNWLLCLLKYVVFRIYGLLIGQYFCNRQSIARHRLWQSYCQYQNRQTSTNTYKCGMNELKFFLYCRPFTIVDLRGNDCDQTKNRMEKHIVSFSNFPRICYWEFCLWCYFTIKYRSPYHTPRIRIIVIIYIDGLTRQSQIS